MSFIFVDEGFLVSSLLPSELPRRRGPEGSGTTGEAAGAASDAPKTT
jgi:hypothetical protein